MIFLIKGLLVDLFGTIIPRPNIKRHKEFMRFMADKTGKDTDFVRYHWRYLYKRRITGADSSSGDFIRYFLDRIEAGNDEELVKAIDSEWFRLTEDLMVFFDDVEPALKRLKEEGIRIGLFSNCGSNVPEIFESRPIFHLFDSVTYSSEEKMSKPDVEFFMRGCEMIGLPPSECAFIGDGDNDELQGSLETGLYTIKIDRKDGSGDYVIKPTPEWNPTVETFYEIFDLIMPRS